MWVARARQGLLQMRKAPSRARARRRVSCRGPRVVVVYELCLPGNQGIPFPARLPQKLPCVGGEDLSQHLSPASCHHRGGQAWAGPQGVGQGPGPPRSAQGCGAGAAEHGTGQRSELALMMQKIPLGPGRTWMACISQDHLQTWGTVSGQGCNHHPTGAGTGGGSGGSLQGPRASPGSRAWPYRERVWSV